MPLPKLNPLQSRLVASIIASTTLLLLYYVFLNAHFAYAAELGSIQHEDHNHNRLGERPFLVVEREDLDIRDTGEYSGSILGFNGGIVARAPQTPTASDPQPLLNNVPITDNVEQGETRSYSFLKASVFGNLSAPTAGLPSLIQARGIEVRTKDHGIHQPIDFTDDDELDPSSELKPRQSDSGDVRTVYISVNTCAQPAPVQNTTIEPPPQLELYVSLFANNTNPGPNSDSSTQERYVLDRGAVMVKVNATGDVFIGLFGQSTTAYKNVWSAEIAVSIDGFYHNFHNPDDSSLDLAIVDSDASASMLITGDLTSENQNSSVYQSWMKTSPPFVLFASNANDRSIYGLQHSYCGLSKLASIKPNNAQNAENVKASITNMTWGGNNQPRQRFYLSGLTSSSTYNVVLGMFGNSTNGGDNVVGGGGQIWEMQTITTLSGGNCALVFDLSFCSQTAYAVPVNPNIFPNITALSAFYDNATQAQYKFFEKVLAQIPCETTSSAQYSLAKKCDDCAAAYKQWLCAVTIPRCTDWSLNDITKPWLQQRNMLQPFPNRTMVGDWPLLKAANQSAFLRSSRNANIDTTVQPGPYNEVLPCDDLCYGIVQSCPASMGFMCPRPGSTSFNHSYAVTSEKKCNYPGNQGTTSLGQRLSAVGFNMLITLVVVGWMFV
ncbi:BcMID1, Ca2+ channel protein [Bisporella sp. PMI_857]|nr:BcMID1, Ca2+ channel protein [Bisporella sp. PMI_857]